MPNKGIRLERKRILACLFLGICLMAVAPMCPEANAQTTPRNKNSKSQVHVSKPQIFAVQLEGLTPEIEKDTARLVHYFQSRFPEPDLRVEAIYYWLIMSFQYDHLGIYDFQRKTSSIPEILKVRLGVCQDVADVFHYLCTKTGIENYFITGFTTNKASIGHAWNVCRYKGKLQQFDATWDLKDAASDKPPGRKFFAPDPLVFNQSHFPYHQMWQIVGRPLSMTEYIEGRFELCKLEGNYRFEDTIRLVSSFTPQQRDSFYLKWFNGQRLYNYASVQEARAYKSHVGNHEFKKLSTAFTLLNKASDEFSSYIDYFNQRFIPKRKDAYFTGLIHDVDSLLQTSDALFRSVKWEYFETVETKSNDQKTFDDNYNTLQRRWIQHKTFIKLYLSKKPFGRTFIFSNPNNLPER